VLGLTKGVTNFFFGLGNTGGRKFCGLYLLYIRESVTTMLSDRSPKSTKDVAKKLEGAQLRDEQNVRAFVSFFRVSICFVVGECRTGLYTHLAE